MLGDIRLCIRVMPVPIQVSAIYDKKEKVQSV